MQKCPIPLHSNTQILLKLQAMYSCVGCLMGVAKSSIEINQMEEQKDFFYTIINFTPSNNFFIYFFTMIMFLILSDLLSCKYFSLTRTLRESEKWCLLFTRFAGASDSIILTSSSPLTTGSSGGLPNVSMKRWHIFVVKSGSGSSRR